MIDLIMNKIIITAINGNRSVPHMVDCVYKVAIVIRNVEDIACYQIGRTRVTRLYACMCMCAIVMVYGRTTIITNSFINSLINKCNWQTDIWSIMPVHIQPLKAINIPYKPQSRINFEYTAGTEYYNTKNSIVGTIKDKMYLYTIFYRTLLHE